MRMKPEKWHDRPRLERLAHVMYPHLSDPETQRQMMETAAVEGKQAGMQRRIDAGAQQKPKSWWGSEAKPNEPSKYDNVPGLRKKEK
jgi:hypothetical protein